LPERERRKSIRPTNPDPPVASSFLPLSICKPLQGQIRPSEESQISKAAETDKAKWDKNGAYLL
jgi:hypothetical protein